MTSTAAVVDRCVAIALDQWGLITHRQALETGLSSSAVQRRLRSASWLRVHPGTYRLREFPVSWEQCVMAACLWLGPHAAASHRAAAQLLEIGVEDAPVEIVATAPKKAITGVRMHVTDRLEPCDMTRVRGIPTTTGSRTLIDLGAVVHRQTVERALEAALRLGCTSIWHLIGRLDVLGVSGRNGVGVLRSVLRERDPRLAPTGSELESMFWELVCLSNLPRPERQFRISDDQGVIGRCDFVYPQQGLVIEVQGARWHLEKPRGSAIWSDAIGSRSPGGAFSRSRGTTSFVSRAR